MIVKVVDMKKAFLQDDTTKEFHDRFAIIEGSEGFLIVDSDACHSIYVNGNIVDVATFEKKPNTICLSPNGRMSFTLDELKEKAVDMDITVFIEYFGIKDRVSRNWDLLEGSAKEIGFKGTLPNWE